MASSIIEVRVDGDVHRVRVPPEWSGAVTITVHVHRGTASKKILVGRAASVYVAEQKEVRDGEA